MEWQNRPLDSIYLIIWMDGIVFKIRDNGKTVNKTVYLCSQNGKKVVLGMWVGKSVLFSLFLLLRYASSLSVKDLYHPTFQFCKLLQKNEKIPKGELSLTQLDNYTKTLLVQVFHEFLWVEDTGSGTRNILRYTSLYYPNYKVVINNGPQFIFSIIYINKVEFLVLKIQQ